MKKNGIILLVVVLLLTSCNSNPTEKRVLNILEMENIEEYSEQEIVVLLEVQEYLLRHFFITYDEFRKGYKEFSYVENEIDSINASAFILRTSGPRDLNLSDLIGLNTKEMYKKISDERSSRGFPEIRIDKDNYIGLEYSISDVYEGYDPGESYVYFRIEMYEKNRRTSMVYRYHFKTIDDKKKVFLKKIFGSASYKNSNNEDINEYLEECEIYYHKKTGKTYEEVLVEYPIVINVKKLTEEYYD